MAQCSHSAYAMEDLSTNGSNNETLSDIDPLTDLLDIEARLDALLFHTTVENLNLNVLNPKRCKTNEVKNDIQRAEGSNKDSKNVKLASLEALLSLGEENTKTELFRRVEMMMTDSIESKNETASQCLLNYFAMLGTVDQTDDFDYHFVDALCQKADINTQDIHGQTLMHEVARDWNTDVAYFLKTRGIRIDVPDKWERTPLLVSVAANNAEMVEWLLNNGANIRHCTGKGEKQYPMHYAGKYDAVEAFEVLLKFGADPIERDDQARTPFFLAAEAGHARICGYFLDLELPTVSYATTGVSTIDEMIKNLPTDQAIRALNQFISADPSNTSRIKLHLSCLGKKRWKLLVKKQHVCNVARITPPTPLELIARKWDFDLINHPVILQYIKLKATWFGNKYIRLNILLHVVFTLLWTVAATIRVGDIEEPYHHPSRGVMHFVLAITLAAQSLTFFFIYKLYRDWMVNREYVRDEKETYEGQYIRSKPFCHPRWIEDTSMMEKKHDAAESLRVNFWRDGWTIIEVLCLLLACGYTAITIWWYITEMKENHSFHHKIRIYYSAIFVLIVWIRVNRCFKSHKSFGPFVAMLGECAAASSQIGFLFAEFFIPFIVAFWVLFGNTAVEGGSEEYMNLNDLIYQLYLLSIVGDYEFDTLKLIHSYAAQVLVGIYVLSISVITINIFIALLSEAFARVNGNAAERTYIEESIFVLNVERIFPETRRDFETYLNRYCAPMVMDKKEFLGNGTQGNAISVISNASKTVTTLNSTVHQIIQTELLARKDLTTLEEKFSEFQQKYADDKTKEMMRHFNAMVRYQTKPYVAAVKRTNKVIAKYVRKTLADMCGSYN